MRSCTKIRGVGEAHPVRRARRQIAACLSPAMASGRDRRDQSRWSLTYPPERCSVWFFASRLLSRWRYLPESLAMNRATSLYLDVVRPVAALVVLLSHVGDQLSFLASAGVQAVDVFFVLSGFVIAHVSASRERDPRVYFISRAARIYSVAIPTLILTVILDSIGLQENAAAYLGPFQPLAPGVLTRCFFL